MSHRFFILTFLLALLSCSAPSGDLQERAVRLGAQIRCPVCRGVPISESPSALAQQMMGEVREQLAQGKSDEAVLQFFQERYGEWILLRPKPAGMNWVVWLAPLFFIVGGAAVILVRAKKESEGSK